ncbi:MAG: hypothetical protein Q9160_000747 [Pyrenula sp. 1 TL-2023]
MADRSNISSDLIWEIARNQNAYLVKRKAAGGLQFSRDPFNLRNLHSRTQDGFVNAKAVGVQPSGEKGVVLKTKKTKSHNRPAHNTNVVTFSNTSNRKWVQRVYLAAPHVKVANGRRRISKGIANYTAKNNYRADLRGDAVARASAIKLSQKPKKETPEKKARGAKAKKAVEKET